MRICPHCYHEEFPDTNICGQCHTSLDKQANPTADHTKLSLIDYKSTSNPGQVDANNFEDDIDLFIGKNTTYFRRKWIKSSKSQTRFSFNLMAFFFPILWLGYRKMYLSVFLISLLALLTDYSLYLLGYELSVKLAAKNIATLTVITVFIMILVGLFGNFSYRKRAELIVKKTQKRTTHFFERNAIYKRKGQTSINGSLIACLIVILFFVFPSYFVPQNFNTIDSIRDGVLHTESDLTMQAVFSTLFTNEVWSYVDEQVNKTDVTFSGVYTEDSEPYHFELYFNAPENEKHFYILQLYINGEEWYYNEEEYDIIEFLSDLYYGGSLVNHLFYTD